jgi:molecular chaperone GrpE
LKDFFKKKSNATPKTDSNMNPMDNNENLEQSPEERAMAADAAATDAETAKLAADLEDLRQTLLRRQADFDNYRKRIEKERADDSKRATARVVEGLIPVIDGFEHALAAHHEKEYEVYRKGFELIYKQLLDNISRMGVERVDPTGKVFDPHIRPWIAWKRPIMKTAQWCRPFSPVMFLTDGSCGQRWCV